jgi:hypothetical protein
MQMMTTIVLMLALAAEPQRIETQYPDVSRVTRLETTMNHLTVIELAEPVTLAAAGSSAFKIERRENKVFIQPLEEGVATNLFVWTNSGRWNYELVPAASVETMHFAIDQRLAAVSEFQMPPLPAVAPEAAAPAQSIAEQMLLLAKPIRNAGVKFETGRVGIAITDVYRKDDQLFIRYMVDNRTMRPYLAGQPEVFALQSARASTSLHSYRYSQIGPEIEKKLRSRAQVKIATVECEVPSEPLPPGEAATGILILQAPPAVTAGEPSVLQFRFPLAGQQSASVTLIL